MTTEKGAREVARLITIGKIPPQFVGRKSFAVLKQEIFSLINRYNPETMTTFELDVYGKDLAKTVESILKHKKQVQDSLFKQFNQEIEHLDQDAKEELENKADKILNAFKNF